MIRLLSASVAAANKAGQIIRDVLESGKLGLVQKVRDAVYLQVPPPSSPASTSLIALSLTVTQGYDDPQTEADRRAQRCIVASLSSQFPNITIIGEEVGG